MTKFKLGFEAKLFIGTAGAAPSDELTNITDVSISLESPEVDVALLLICEVPEGDSPEERAAEWLGVLQTAAEAVLESGTTPNAGVKFVSAEAAELPDAELLALSGIFRAQINVRCLLLSGPAQS